MTELIIIVVAAIAFVGGWKAREYQATRFLTNYRKAIEESMAAEISNTILIDIQREGDQFFIYNKATGEFLAQGNSHTEVSVVLSSRFPCKRFIATPQNLEDVGYKK
jgi:hypothetical protein